MNVAFVVFPAPVHTFNLNTQPTGHEYKEGAENWC